MGIDPHNKKSPKQNCWFPLIYLPCNVTEDTVKRNLFIFISGDIKLNYQILILRNKTNSESILSHKQFEVNRNKNYFCLCHNRNKLSFVTQNKILCSVFIKLNMSWHVRLNSQCLYWSFAQKRNILQKLSLICSSLTTI